MPRPDVPIHYLPENAREWTPAHVAFFDTETRVTVDDKGETHTLRLWAGRAVDRRPVKGGKARDVSEHGRTGIELAEWVGRVAKGRGSTWIFAHNLTFDLSTSALPRHLTRQGWEVKHATMGGKSCWMRLGRKSATVTLLDSFTYLPVELGAIGAAVGIPKRPLPTADAPEAEWLARCQTDVDILALGMLDFMAWFDEHKLGNMSTTGAATGWNVYRHHPETRPVVIHPEPEIIAEDRAYVNGGRRAVWQLGKHTEGPYLELDILGAYPTIAANLPLPKQHRAPFTSLPLDAWQIDSDRWGPVARCRVRTSTPSVPVKYRGVTFYPVGEFWANLCGPDIKAARDAGTLLEIGPGRIHQLGRSMAAWASWALATMAGDVPNTPEVARFAVKHWSRSTIGKWASRAFITTELGPAPDSGWGYEDAWDSTRGCRASVQDIAGQRYVISAGGDPENAYPVVFAWVESYVRVALTAIIERIGEGALLSANTDGLIAAQRKIGTGASGGLIAPAHLTSSVDRTAWVIDQCNAAIAPLTLRTKSSSGGVTVLGPSHVKVGHRRGFSGIPTGATEVAPDTYQFDTWPGIDAQLRRGMRGDYRRDKRTVKIVGPFPTGWALDSGTVRPVEMTTNPDGSNRMLPWGETRWAALAENLGPVQRRELQDLT